MKLYTALVLALLVLAVNAEAEHDEQDDRHSYKGFDLKFIGKSPKFQFAPSGDNSSWVRVEFGSVYEQTETGQSIPAHSIDSLAAAKPEYTTGFETVNSTNVTFVLMTLPFANLTALKYNGSNCSSPVVSKDDFAAGYLAIKVYFGFSEDVIFPYGANNTVVAPANSTKFSIAAQGWPFCSTGNTLQIELETSTGAGEAAKPIHSDELEDDEQDAAEPVSANATAGSVSSSSTPPGSRKLLGSDNNNNNDNDNGNSNGNGNDHGNSHANPKDGAAAAGAGAGADHGKPSGRPPRPPHPRDPRVVGKPRTHIALLNGKPGRAAMLDFEDFAYDAIDGTQLYNVTAAIMEHGPHLMVTLGFPYFTSIYYDPTVAADVDSTVAGYSSNSTADVVSAPAHKNAGESLRLGGLSILAGGLLLALLL